MTVEQLALTLKDKHWFAIVDAAPDGVGYICSDFEEGGLTSQQCRDLFAYRNEVAAGLNDEERAALLYACTDTGTCKDGCDRLIKLGLIRDVGDDWEAHSTHFGRAVVRKVRADSALERWAREKALTLEKRIWLALDFVPPEDDADWVGAVALGVMECPEGPSYEHLLTNKGSALLAMRNKVAAGLNPTESMVLCAGPGLAAAQPNLRDLELVRVDDDGMAYFTPFGREVARVLESS